MDPTLTDHKPSYDGIPTTKLIEELFAGSRRRSIRRHNEAVLKDARRRQRVLHRLASRLRSR